MRFLFQREKQTTQLTISRETQQRQNKGFILSRTQNRFRYPISQKRREKVKSSKPSNPRTQIPKIARLLTATRTQQKENIFREMGFKENQTISKRIPEAQSVSRRTPENT